MRTLNPLLRHGAVIFAWTIFWLPPLTNAGEGNTNGLAPLVKTAAAHSVPSALSAEEILKASAQGLRKRFDEWLENPSEYRQKALRECKAFPEGRIYPFAIPVLAYANLALVDAKERTHAALQMKKLIDAFVDTVVEDISPPGADLHQLTNYQNQGTRLATLNLTLACYALVSNDPRYASLHDHLSLLLRQALSGKPVTPLASYPEYTWYFDTIIALVSLELYDRAHGLALTRELLERHLAWVRRHATDAETDLPIAYQGGLPRGCDISMQVCLLQQIDSGVARRLYANYAKHHWADLGFIAGFREWPRSKGQSLAGDIDSGPLFLGLGPTATGVGIGAARSVSDTNRFNVLAKQLHYLPVLMKQLEQGEQKLFGGEVPVNSQYTTGFLYGDAILFYSVTWVPYPQPQQRNHHALD